MQGKIIGVKINGEFVPCETSCTLNMESERIPSSSKQSGNWKSSIAGYRSWSVSVNGRFSVNSSSAGVMEIAKALKRGEDLFLIITTRVDVLSTFSYSGYAGTTNVTIEAPSNGTAVWSGTFQGVGELDIQYDDFLDMTIINAMPVDADKPFIVDTTHWGA